MSFCVNFFRCFGTCVYMSWRCVIMIKKERKESEPFPCSVYISKLSKHQSTLSLCETRTWWLFWSNMLEKKKLGWRRTRLCLETKRLLYSHHNTANTVPYVLYILHTQYAMEYCRDFQEVQHWRQHYCDTTALHLDRIDCKRPYAVLWLHHLRRLHKRRFEWVTPWYSIARSLFNKKNMYDGFDERERNETYHMQRAVESNVYDLTRSHLHHSAINVLQLRTDTDTLQHAFLQPCVEVCPS